MDVQSIVRALDGEIKTLTRARDILDGEFTPHKTIKRKMSDSLPNGLHHKRPMSVATRKRMAAAMKKRWRDAKRAGKQGI